MIINDFNVHTIGISDWEYGKDILHAAVKENWLNPSPFSCITTKIPKVIIDLFKDRISNPPVSQVSIISTSSLVNLKKLNDVKLLPEPVPKELDFLSMKKILFELQQR